MPEDLSGALKMLFAGHKHFDISMFKELLEKVEAQ